MSGAPADILNRLVAAGEEPGGAVAVVRDGVVEMDHGAGTRDGSMPWTSDTLVMAYSVAKPFTALTVLEAVAQGAIRLSTPVAAVWPEYGRHGKQDTTVRHLLSHQAGLPCFPLAARRVAYDDREALVDLLAAAPPTHRPGAAVAEHALTYGHLLDEVLRRTTGEPLDRRFARLAGSVGWDLHLRVEEADLPRVATMVEASSRWREDYLADPRWGPALGRPEGLLDPGTLNSVRFRRTPFPAIALHASAVALASFYDDVGRPDGTVADLLGHRTWRAFVEPAATGHDLVLDRMVTWTLGFQIDQADGSVDLGMGGAGGCTAWTGLTAGFGAAYLTRGLGGGDRADEVCDAVDGRFSRPLE